MSTNQYLIRTRYEIWRELQQQQLLIFLEASGDIRAPATTWIHWYEIYSHEKERQKYGCVKRAIRQIDRETPEKCTIDEIFFKQVIAKMEEKIAVHYKFFAKNSKF